jgi:hypothetical protein
MAAGFPVSVHLFFYSAFCILCYIYHHAYTASSTASSTVPSQSGLHEWVTVGIHIPGVMGQITSMSGGKWADHACICALGNGPASRPSPVSSLSDGLDSMTCDLSVRQCQDYIHVYMPIIMMKSFCVLVLVLESSTTTDVHNVPQ